MGGGVFLSFLIAFFSGCDSSSSVAEPKAPDAGPPNPNQNQATVTDQTTVSSIVTSFDAASPATIAPPSGNSYTRAATSRDIVTEDDGYASDIAGISGSEIEIDLADESSWDAEKISRDGELVTVALSGDAKVKITGAASKKTAFLFANKKGKSVAITFCEANFSSENFPCVEFEKKAKKIYVVSEGENSLTDGRKFGTGYGSKFTDAANSATYADREVSAAWVENGSSKKGSIYAKGPAVLCGTGTLTLSEGYKHGFYSTDYIRVASGKWKINSTGRNAIQSANGFVMSAGEIQISGTGSHTNNESRGIVVEGMDAEEEDGVTTSNENPGEGFVWISGGTLKIATVGKAITAKWDIDDDAVSSQTSDDPFPFVFISGGNIEIETTGNPKDESGTSYTFLDADGVSVSEKTKLSPEGIEGKQAVVITGGKIEINATDDGINAARESQSCGGWVWISGGNIFINASSNDAIDSNGNLYISGGVVAAYGTKTPECAFDCDQNTFAITGGLLVGVGTNNYSEPTSSSATQGVFVLSSGNYGSGTLAVLNSGGEAVFAYDVPSGITNGSLVMILSSPNIQAGTYTLKTGCTATGGETFHNLYTTIPAISGGSGSTTFTTKSGSFVQSATGGMTNGGPQEGSHPNAGPGGR